MQVASGQLNPEQFHVMNKPYVPELPVGIYPGQELFFIHIHLLGLDTCAMHDLKNRYPCQKNQYGGRGPLNAEQCEIAPYCCWNPVQISDEQVSTLTNKEITKAANVPWCYYNVFFIFHDQYKLKKNLSGTLISLHQLSALDFSDTVSNLTPSSTLDPSRILSPASEQSTLTTKSRRFSTSEQTAVSLVFQNSSASPSEVAAGTSLSTTPLTRSHSATSRSTLFQNPFSRSSHLQLSLCQSPASATLIFSACHSFTTSVKLATTTLTCSSTAESRATRPRSIPQRSTTASSSSDAAGRMTKRSSANTTGFHDATRVNDRTPALQPTFHSIWTFPSSLLAPLLLATSNSPDLQPPFNLTPLPQTYDDFKFLSFTKLFKTTKAWTKSSLMT
ncbi:unnamed protein product [Oikopleura dioica]|uniref:P-type domain-containing protein n=1 Tax=Oikopleura dioica TaxID=34765 RepID=E4YPU3_OIKDI|nr:unnamed protein product [Oikopleura dioica]